MVHLPIADPGADLVAAAASTARVEPSSQGRGAPRRSDRPLRRRPGRDSRVVSQPLSLIQGSLSARKVERQSPLLASLHRGADGVLVGLGLATLGLSALTLHWQNQWSQTYGQLEADQVLEHRLLESSALLEQQFIGAAHRPGQLEPTSSDKLFYLPAPAASEASSHLGSDLLARVSARPIPAGY